MNKVLRTLIVSIAVVACLAGIAVIALPHFFAVDPSTRQGRALRLVDQADAVWIRAESRGIENILPVPGSTTLYASDLSGFVTRFDGTDRKHLAITATRKVGDYALGLALAPARDRALDGNGNLFVATSEGGEHGWSEGETMIRILGEDLAERGSIPVGLPCLNGIALDSRGGLWLASSNFSFIHPEGMISYMAGDARPGMVTVATGGLFNGLCARTDGSVLAADTLCSIFAFTGSDADRALAGGKPIRTKPRSPLALYRKSSFIEAFDDVCADSRGRVWSANPLTKGHIAVYDPAARERRLVELPGFGYASSCRVRMEGTREILYVSELRSPDGSGFDGRGILAFPIDALTESGR